MICDKSFLAILFGYAGLKLKWPGRRLSHLFKLTTLRKRVVFIAAKGRESN